MKKRSRSKNLQRLGYRRIVQLLIYLVIIPTAMLLTLGIILMFLGEAKHNLIFGIFTVTLVGLVVVGVILVLVFVNREANLSELQADFVSKVSHELKTPLTSIRLFTETLRTRRGERETEEACITQILGETDRLSDKIDRLLDWGRMESGRRVYDLQPESVEEILRDAIESYPPARLGDLNLKLTIEPDLPRIDADRSALVDAIVNLLSNAHKYGGTTPFVELQASSKGGKVCISVRDNGAGIERSEQKRIFQKFYRIDDRLSRTREGSGLGLAIVSHVVRAHSGEIVLESSLGQGSLFSLYFPPSTDLSKSS